MPLNTVEELVADIRAGKMVILMDDEDRENEGDLVIAATHVRPEDINFMITHARGLVSPNLKQRALPAVKFTSHGRCQWRTARYKLHIVN